MGNFKETVLKGLNKSEKELQEEQVDIFIEDSTIECEMQIALYKTSLIPTKEIELKREKAKLAKVKKELVNARFSVAYNFKDYVGGINSKKETILVHEIRVATDTASIKQLKAEMKEYENILKDLNS